MSKEVKTGTVFFPSEEMLNVAKEVLISKTLNSAETFSNSARLTNGGEYFY